MLVVNNNEIEDKILELQATMVSALSNFDKYLLQEGVLDILVRGEDNITIKTMSQILTETNMLEQNLTRNINDLSKKLIILEQTVLLKNMQKTLEETIAEKEKDKDTEIKIQSTITIEDNIQQSL
ncbi:34073_t:CDS:2, partial [Gigaspora margarita]